MPVAYLEWLCDLLIEGVGAMRTMPLPQLAAQSDSLCKAIGEIRRQAMAIGVISPAPGHPPSPLEQGLQDLEVAISMAAERRTPAKADRDLDRAREALQAVHAAFTAAKAAYSAEDAKADRKRLSHQHQDPAIVIRRD